MAVFTLNLHTFHWQRLRGRKTVRQRKHTTPFDAPSRGGPAMAAGNGGLLVCGGHSRSAETSRDPGPHLWQLTLPLAMDWQRERLLWIACYKGDRRECGLARCPPHVIYHILSYVNAQRFCVT